MTELEILRLEIGKLELKPGDTLVVRVPDRLTEAKIMQISRQVKEVTGPYSILVMGKDHELQILRKEKQ